MRRQFAVTFAAVTLALGAAACQSGATGSAAPQGLAGAAVTTRSDPATTAAPTGTPAVMTTAPAATTTAVTTAAPTTTHQAPAVSTAPKPHPATTRPAPVVTTPPAATCMHHTVGRCGAGEPHPAGTTAQCNDGTYSYSTTPSGTCSHHQGVAVWYY